MHERGRALVAKRELQNVSGGGKRTHDLGMWNRENSRAHAADRISTTAARSLGPGRRLPPPAPTRPTRPRHRHRHSIGIAASASMPLGMSGSIGGVGRSALSASSAAAEAASSPAATAAATVTWARAVRVGVQADTKQVGRHSLALLPLLLLVVHLVRVVTQLTHALQHVLLGQLAQRRVFKVHLFRAQRAPAALVAIAGALSCALVELELADEPVRFPKKRTKTLADALFHLYSLRPAPLRPSNISPCHTRTQGSDCRCAPRSGAQTVVVVRRREAPGALSCDEEARKAYHHRLSEDAACRGGHDGRCLGVQGGSWGTTPQLAARSPVGKPAGTQVYNHKKKPDLHRPRIHIFL